MMSLRSRTILALALAATPLALRAQTTAECAEIAAGTNHAEMDHAKHQQQMAVCEKARLPTVPAQAAYAALSEVTRLLTADPATDWTKVNMEALRQHLIDMDDVTMRANVVQRPVAGGMEAVVTGSGRVAAAIKRMVVSHAAMLDGSPDYAARAEPLPNGVRLTVTARGQGSERAIARIRGLGFAGLLTEGDHHAAHHMALARGEAMAHGAR
jgi:hypothetical protein